MQASSISFSSLPLPRKLAIGSACLGIAFWATAARAPEAHACGCFGRPNPAVPVVQAGERILFSMKNGVVSAHIQIQYAGAAEEFAWLLPLPSEPTLKLGTDELFTQLINSTQPVYQVNSTFNGECILPPAPAPAPPPDAGAGNPLVSRDTVGPYDYAVLRADEKQPLLDWLNQERFFVPAGTDDVIEPYIREGAFFLALKLRSDRDVGDLQPVVVEYPSELPMIPIVLTSVAADPDMPVLVWVLGESRAIPRNFYHTQINDAQIDWLGRGSNYIEVVTEAVDEADGHHSFLTEYAGTSAIMRDVLDPEWRFGNLEEVALIADPIAYMEYVRDSGYRWDPQLLSILQRHLPMPPELAERNFSVFLYYFLFSDYFGQYQIEYPDQAAIIYADFDPALLTAELAEAIVTPTRAAGQLFREFPYLSRLFTTLSPDEMTKDPVFSFNPDLPDVSNVHVAELIYECDPDIFNLSEVPARLITEQGWVLDMPNGTGSYDWLNVAMPASLRIEMLREEGAPEVVADKEERIEDAIRDFRNPGGTDEGSAGSGCAVGPHQGSRGLAGMALLGLAVVALLRHRRLD